MGDYAARWGRDRTRVTKGHPEREARRERAAERLAVHVYDPERCKPGCLRAYPIKPLRASVGRPTTDGGAPASASAGLGRPTEPPRDGLAGPGG